ncbi:hypothetical protein HanIR_Chr14g0716911 [Helianthus annuus]|nr:hypothetical protein HanIR_Chr14g0716911 [Helianthus annuus]
MPPTSKSALTSDIPSVLRAGKTAAETGTPENLLVKFPGCFMPENMKSSTVRDEEFLHWWWVWVEGRQ